MPSGKEHCQSCREKYGYDFSEIHNWMDEPIALYSHAHRKERHDKNSTPDKAEQLFWNKVPEPYRKFNRDAVLDHLMLDYVQPDNNHTASKQKHGEKQQEPFWEIIARKKPKLNWYRNDYVGRAVG